MKRVLKRVIKKTRILRRLNFTWVKEVNGERIKIPIVGEIGVANLSISEPWMVRLLSDLLKTKQGLFIDVGVNVGQTLIIFRTIAPDMQYVGFEPNPVCISYVSRLIEANDFKNCVIVPVGLFNQDTIRKLYSFYESEVDSTASVITEFSRNQPVHHKQYVPLFSFETIAPTLDLKDDIAIIKIDVEGAELEVIEGLYQAISTYRPIVVVEILPVYSNENQVRKRRQDRIEQILSNLDYKLSRVKKDSNHQYAGLQEITTIGIHCDLDQCNYVALPEELTGSGVLPKN